jgi:V/A-type H+-transporting ATPase subunit I
MIVPMRHVTLLCVEPERQQTLERLREMGVLHLNLAAADSEPYRQAQARLVSAQNALRLLADARADKPVMPTTIGPHKVRGHELSVEALLSAPLPLIAGDAAAKIDAIHHLAELRQALVNEAERLDRDIALYQPFGEFDVTLPARLTAQGLPVQLFRDPVNTTFVETEGVLIEEFGADDDFTYCVMVGAGELPEACERLEPPEVPVSVLQARYAQALDQADRVAARLKQGASSTADLASEILRLSDLSDFATAAETLQTHGAVAWITGWLPSDLEPALSTAAAEHAWGLLLRDPEPSDLPPTLLRPPRLFRPVLALFEALGISPAYSESDISIPFFCFFSIFFAMLVGDGGYGALIFLLTLYARRKLSHAPHAPFVLLYVFALATMVWGALSNTWFGTHPAFASQAVSLWLNHPDKGINNTMLVCFSLGVVHLSVARIWGAISLFPDSKFLAQVGWVGILGFMYCMACHVVGVFVAPTFIYYVFGLALFLVFFFSLKRGELRERGIELGMMPLNIVSCLGDIISYVRLFAVGLASVKVAENFNSMAINLDLPLWAKIIPLVLILLIGHGLNFAMAGLSILVHAVRLNTLEFSNHKGVSWSGYTFKPFKRKTTNGATP